MLSTYKEGDTFLVKKIFNNYQTNDLLYFKYPVYDSAMPSVSVIQRLIGLPGDTVQIIKKKIYLNNYPIRDTSTLQYNYFIKTRIKPDTHFLLRYNLFEGGSVSDDLDYSYSLNKTVAEELKKDSLVVNVELKCEKKESFDETVFPYSTQFNWNMDNFGKLYLPKKNDTLRLDLINIHLYATLIVEFENNSLFMKRDSIFINNQLTKTYVVKNNYYFVMGDNRDNANDSRVFGFLPEQYIKGKVVAFIKRQNK